MENYVLRGGKKHKIEGGDQNPNAIQIWIQNPESTYNKFLFWVELKHSSNLSSERNKLCHSKDLLDLHDNRITLSKR